jgi:putative copper export protein
MLTVNWDTIRLFLHVTAATVWVGGQLALAALIPALRTAGADIPAVAASAFRRVAWPAFGITILTGIWSVAAEHEANHGAYSHTLIMKLVLVAISGVAAGLQTRSQTRGQNAALGALAALTALGAVFAGIMLAG